MKSPIIRKNEKGDEFYIKKIDCYLVHKLYKPKENITGIQEIVERHNYILDNNNCWLISKEQFKNKEYEFDFHFKREIQIQFPI